MLCIGLPPSIDEDCTTLVLGSMPGVASLSAQQYYAHPRNRFWPMMTALLEEQPPETYEEKLRMLLRHHIALWDSIARCEREGSLDSKIKNEEGADIGTLLESYPKIKVICLNGGKSSSAFKRHNGALLARRDLSIHALPSTSPANARWTLEKLTAAWRDALFPAV